MPMNVSSVIIYLAIVLAGYVVVSIADSFSPREIAMRLELSKSKAIFTQVSPPFLFWRTIKQQIFELIFFMDFKLPKYIFTAVWK